MGDHDHDAAAGADAPAKPKRTRGRGRKSVAAAAPEAVSDEAATATPAEAPEPVAAPVAEAVRDAVGAALGAPETEGVTQPTPATPGTQPAPDRPRLGPDVSALGAPQPDVELPVGSPAEPRRFERPARDERRRGGYGNERDERRRDDGRHAQKQSSHGVTPCVARAPYHAGGASTVAASGLIATGLS